jgi:hypothetical protein
MVPVDGTAHLAAALPLPRGMLTNINHHRGSVRMVDSEVIQLRIVRIGCYSGPEVPVAGETELWRGRLGLEPATSCVTDRRISSWVTRYSRAKVPCCNHLDFPARSLAGTTRTTRL